MSTPVDVPLVGNEHKIEGYNFGKEVKAVAVSPMHDAIIVGGRDGIAIFTYIYLVFKMLKIEADLSIKNVLKNFNNQKGTNGVKGALEIKWN